MTCPRVYHSKRPENYVQTIQACAKNIHMRTQSEKLLLFYASQKHGFSPCLSLISERTGIPKNKVSEVRQRLVDFGIINYNRDESYIYIAWDRIRAYAMLEEPLKLSRNKCKFFPFHEIPEEKKRKKKTLEEYGKKYFIKEERKLSKEEDRFFIILQSMTEEEYVLMTEGIRETEFPHYPQGQAIENIKNHFY